MARELRGRRILITGASSGIGLALAEQAASQGARVALVARSRDTLAQVAGKIHSGGGEALAIPADITVPADRARVFDTVVAQWGGLDVLINNAGVGATGHFIECSEPILRQVMEVNFFAPAELIRLAIPILTKGEQPAIVNVSSMCGRRAMPAWPEYSASKYALAGLTESLRGELIRFGIDVLLMVPGLTNSNLNAHLLHNKARHQYDFAACMTPEEVAKAILRSLRSGRRETVIGREARWLLRFNRYWPWLVDRLLIRKVRQLWCKPEKTPAVANQAN